jgi:uroporphyrinogen III methyltransferase/synthase
MKLRIGTRGSRLAMTQTRSIANWIEENRQDIEIEIISIQTKGDINKVTPLDKIGDKGIFTKEIEKALLNDEIDIAVHSMKDLPSVLPEGLILVPPMKREDPRDVFITPHKIKALSELPKNPVIATGSKRRKAELLRTIETVSVENIRGNVETRIEKMLDQKLDGIVLASAGINRLGLHNRETYSIIPFEIMEMIPAVAQGIIGIEIKENRSDLVALFHEIGDKTTWLQATAERNFLKSVNGGCHIPVGAYLDVQEDKVTLHGLYGDDTCQKLARKSVTGLSSEILELSSRLAQELVWEVEHGA